MTKTSVLVLGNSHVAALRRGWTQVALDFPGWSLEFFAANSNLFNKMTLDEERVFGAHGANRLSVRQHGWLSRVFGLRVTNRLERWLRPGKDMDVVGYTAHQLKFLDQVFRRHLVDLKAFDHVILVGRNANEVDFLRQFEVYSIDGICERDDRPRLSKAAFSRFSYEIALKRLPDAMWHNWDHPRLAFLPAPVPRADCPGDDPRYDVWARYGANPATGLPFINAYRAHVATLYRDYGITLLSPPDAVYDDSGLTRVEFGDDSMRLHPRAGVYEQSDFHHMNAEYGKVVLRHILQQLA